MTIPAQNKKPPLRMASIDTAATLAGCSPRTIRRYISQGRLSGYRMGPRLIRVDLAEIDALLSPILTTQAS
jgi:excisionase family DNA binding protein